MTGPKYLSFLKNVLKNIPINKRNLGYTVTFITIASTFDKYFNDKGTESNEDPESSKLCKEIVSKGPSLTLDDEENYKKSFGEDIGRKHFSKEKIYNPSNKEVHNTYVANSEVGHAYVKYKVEFLEGQAHSNAKNLKPKGHSVLLLAEMPLKAIPINKEQYETLYKSFQIGNKE